MLMHLKYLHLSIFIMGIVLSSLDAQSSQENEESLNKTQMKSIDREEKVEQILDFSSLKSVLEKDQLEPFNEERKKKIKVYKEKKKIIQESKKLFPNREDFLFWMGRQWLITQHTKLDWNHSRPAYGIQERFTELLKELGIMYVKHELLIIDSPDLAYGVIPGNYESSLYIVSLPFIRALDLSKLEIALLMLDSLLRQKMKLYEAKIPQTLKILTGYNKVEISKEDQLKSSINQALMEYNRFMLEKGYDFKDQYKLTKELASMLKSRPKLWNTYYKLLSKIENLVNVNELFKNYIKLYPTPDLQKKWMSEESK